MRNLEDGYKTIIRGVLTVDAPSKKSPASAVYLFIILILSGGIFREKYFFIFYFFICQAQKIPQTIFHLRITKTYAHSSSSSSGSTKSISISNISSAKNIGVPRAKIRTTITCLHNGCSSNPASTKFYNKRANQIAQKITINTCNPILHHYTPIA